MRPRNDCQKASSTTTRGFGCEVGVCAQLVMSTSPSSSSHKPVIPSSHDRHNGHLYARAPSDDLWCERRTRQASFCCPYPSDPSYSSLLPTSPFATSLHLSFAPLHLVYTGLSIPPSTRPQSCTPRLGNTALALAKLLSHGIVQQPPLH